MRTDTGGLVGNHANAYVILTHDEAWEGVLAYDEFSHQIKKLKAPPYVGGEAGAFSDADIGKTLVWLQQKWRLPLKQMKAADDAVRMVASDHRYHDVRDWLLSLPKWDGEMRLQGLLAGGFGTAFNQYTIHIGTGWLVSAVARVLNPGCKVDTMLVLEGDQGRGKSTAIRDLFGAQWYVEIAESPHNKDFLVVIQGAWVVEIGEMQSFNKSEISMVKSTITRRDDKFRAPYDRYASSHPRQCVFAGTTNAEAYLSDPTGARRFLPATCGAINLTWIRENRDQLWAEALAAYRDGFAWWDFPADMAQAEQARRYVADSWEEPILIYLEGRAPSNQYDINHTGLVNEASTTQLLHRALGVEIGKHTRQDQLRVGSIMRRLGWKLGGTKRVGATYTRFYERPADDVA